MPALKMTLKTGTGQACAACKHQRRRCTPECLLAPFFPADQPKAFQSVHRLFGVKHVQNLLKELAPHEKAMAINSIKFHAAMRERHPVYGCLVEIQHLAYQIQLAEDELQLVLQQLAHYRQREMATGEDYISQQQLGMHNPENINFADFNCNLEYKENNEVDSLFIQQTCNNNNNSMVLQSQLAASPPETIQNYNEMHPFFDDMDDRQSCIGSKEAFEFSLESPLKDSKHSREEIADNELKSAAACFSLTSVN
ncbi:LOB domain-containing protein 27 [Phtheirospermum japonicum]|uniref:LOB domain-containing protein 27 n=1 Tax=Phtheirospermum japonicum TaxID=374723 RepID=A0A830CHD7_9LAMI|nr:LOB domain-containing protein 27 [Phtheirospermum japonicum]